MNDKVVLRRKIDNTYWIGKALSHPFSHVYFASRLKCLSSEREGDRLMMLLSEVELVTEAELTAIIYGD